MVDSKTLEQNVKTIGKTCKAKPKQRIFDLYK